MRKYKSTSIEDLANLKYENNENNNNWRTNKKNNKRRNK
jgi:hypothetical protein